MKSTLSSRRTRLGAGIALAGAAVVVLSGCAGSSEPAADGSAGSFEGQELVVSVWGGTYQEAVAQAAGPAFEEATGAKLVFDTGSGPDRLNKIVSSVGAETDDVMLNSAEFTIAAQDAGALAPLEGDSLSNYADTADWAKPFDFGVAFGVYALGIAYDPTVVTTPPTSWNDLWNPEFAGKLALPAVTHSAMPALLVTAAELNGGSIDDIQPGIDALAELKPAKTSFFWTDWAPLAQSGEVVAAAEFDLYASTMERSGDYDIAFAYPEEGAIASLAVASVVDTGNDTKEALAREFIDILLAADTQEQIAELMYQSPANVTAVIPDDVADVVLTADEMQQKARFFDDAALAAKRAEWTQLLNTEVLPKWE